MYRQGLFWLFSVVAGFDVLTGRESRRDIAQTMDTCLSAPPELAGGQVALRSR